MDEFNEDEVGEVANSLGADPAQAWEIYQQALRDAQDDAPLGPIIG
jgi:hypothetical protein